MIISPPQHPQELPSVTQLSLPPADFSFSWIQNQGSIMARGPRTIVCCGSALFVFSASTMTLWEICLFSLQLDLKEVMFKHTGMCAGIRWCAAISVGLGVMA